MSPSRGGLGLRSLRLHSSACFIAYMSHFGIAFEENHHLEQSLIEFNGAVEGMEGIGLQDIIDAPPHQRQLSSMIEDHQFKIIFDILLHRLTVPGSSQCPLPMQGRI